MKTGSSEGGWKRQGGVRLGGRGREAEGYSVETIRANISGGLESKNMKNASAMPSPGRAKLRLADLVSDDHPLHGRPSGVGAPSPPRVMPHMSSDDTDAAIQILENRIRSSHSKEDKRRRLESLTSPHKTSLTEHGILYFLRLKN